MSVLNSRGIKVQLVNLLSNQLRVRLHLCACSEVSRVEVGLSAGQLEQEENRARAAAMVRIL